MIKFTNLNKYFNKGKKNEIHVINNASLELPDNGIVTFFGHSGSGKTTLLNVVGGLDSFKGEIQYDNEVINNYQMGRIDKWRAQNVGYVFQNYDLLQNETVYDNLEIALSIIGINDKEEAKKRIEYALKSVGLYKYRKKKAFALSGGQMQRVAIARALVKKCKILIADEPTGNLDSANTIEVMNVLKSISKNTLVLLVTHEKNIADFYSDQIIEMADGQITSIKENHSKEASLLEEHSNAVYLGDMEKIEEDSDAINLTIYKEPGDDSKKHLEVFIKNNTLYIRGDTTIRIANDNTLKVIDGKRKVMSSKEEAKETYDNSFYDDTKKGKRGFRSSLISFLSSWQSIFSAKKKTKLIYASMVMMGFVFSSSAMSYVNNTMADDSNFAYANGYYSTLGASYNVLNQVLRSYDDGYVDTAYGKEYGSYQFQEQVTFAEAITSNLNAFKMPFDESLVSLAKGRKPTSSDEIVISQNLADYILSGFTVKKSYDYLLDKKIKDEWQSDYEYTLVGISKEDNNCMYFTERALDFQKNSWDYNDYNITILNSQIEKNHYKIIEGRDVGDSSAVSECIIAKPMVGQPNSCYLIDGETKELDTSHLKYDGTERLGTYRIVGAFEFDSDILFADSVIITNKTANPYQGYSGDMYVNPYDGYSSNLAYIVEGREPKKSNEIVVNAYSSYNVGSSIDGYTIVGRFSGGAYISDRFSLVNNNIANINGYYGNNCVFTTSNFERAQEYFEKIDILFDTDYNIQYTQKIESDSENRAVFYTSFIVSFVIGSVFIFFIMRSRMLADIYTIGVYRSLGAKRWKIVSKYLLESAMLTLLLTISGYIVGLLVYTGFSMLINTLIGQTIAMSSFGIYFLIGLIIFASSTLVGTLPIVTLFLKTPAQIKSKYDI